jgi:hypothetical protein
MSSTFMVMAEMLITLGVCLGFGFHQLWDLRRLKAKAAAEKAAGERQAGTGEALSGS